MNRFLQVVLGLGISVLLIAIMVVVRTPGAPPGEVLVGKPEHKFGSAEADEFWNRANRDLRAHLLKEGDDGTKPRLVDFFAMFEDPGAAKAFSAFVVKHGYDLDPDLSNATNVAFTKVTPVTQAALDDALATLVIEAHRLGGALDGWACGPN